jgi:hypothetical protein
MVTMLRVAQACIPEAHVSCFLVQPDHSALKISERQKPFRDNKMQHTHGVITTGFTLLHPTPAHASVHRIMQSHSQAPQRHVWQAVKCSSLDEMRTQNIRFWQRAGGAAIRKAAWELVVETWKTQHRNLDELRFQRLAPPVRRA